MSKSTSCKITDLKACMGLLKIKKKIKFIGIRAGEKLHETLIYEEFIFTKKYQNHFIIKNSINLKNLIYIPEIIKKCSLIHHEKNYQ